MKKGCYSGTDFIQLRLDFLSMVIARHGTHVHIHSATVRALPLCLSKDDRHSVGKVGLDNSLMAFMDHCLSQATLALFES